MPLKTGIPVLQGGEDVKPSTDGIAPRLTADPDCQKGGK